ncbi:helix-turn-helix transcriptional regulator [Streptomyces aquilus]|uniref:helix-turn-helix transcriptional regulator n=1 Tax=Streptomyces aquilus TaxID=2548456 RepID=UPI0037D1BB15
MITLKEIEQEHGVSRLALHNYRRNASFPRPVVAEGSTRVQYRADEVGAWFEANPPSQGKRADLTPRDEGAAMPRTMEQIMSEGVTKPDYLTEKQWVGLTLAVLHGVAEGVERAGFEGWESDLGVAAVAAVRARLDELVNGEGDREL